MNKIFAALLLLLFSSGIMAADRILILYSDIVPAGAMDTYSAQINNETLTIMAIAGLRYDAVLASDTTAVAAALTSEKYQQAWCLYLPKLTTSYDSESELAAVGWPYLSMYINRNSSKAFPIPLVIQIGHGHSLPTTGCWAFANTGQMGSRSNYIAAPGDVAITDAQGDTIYTRPYADGTTISRIPDSLSWIDPMVWDDVAGATAHQVFCRMWRTVGAGDHQVIYLQHENWSDFLSYAAMAMFNRVTPAEIPMLVNDLGYLDKSIFGTTATIDTVAFGRCMADIEQYVVAHDMKLEFCVNVPYFVYHNNATLNSLATYAALHPDNLRLTPSSVKALGDNGTAASGYDWFRYNGTQYMTTMKRRVDAALDQGVADAELGPVLDRTRMYGYIGNYTAYLNTSVDSVVAALRELGITDAYVIGNAFEGGMPPGQSYRGLCYPTRILNDDGTEFRTHAMGKNYYSVGYPRGGGGTLDSAKVDYFIRIAPYRAVYSAQKFMYAWGLTNYLWGPDAVSLAAQGFYQPGFVYPPSFLTGGSHTGGGYHLAGIDSTQAMMKYYLEDMRQTVNMANYIVSEYGTVKQIPFVYAWLKDVVWDRYCRQRYPNSHVRIE